MTNFTSNLLGAVEPWVYIVIGSAAAAVIAVIVMIIIAFKANKKPGGKTAQKIKTIGGVRYSEDNQIEIGKSLNVTHNVGDIMLARGQTYTARKGGKKGDLLPGQYTLLAGAKGEDRFNIRLGVLVREYRHGDAVVIPDGESITCTSHSVVLR